MTLREREEGQECGSQERTPLAPLVRPSAERIAHLVVPIPSREPAQAKAIRLLISGRVRVKLVRAGRCWARVNGDTEVYEVGCSRGRWHCSCIGYGDRCSHIKAVQMVVDLSTGGTE